MATDVLTLGGIVFDDFSTPERVPFGGNQAIVVHKLPGGSRAIDTLGPDDKDIVLQGKFFNDGAYATALALDAMRAAGQVLPLVWGGTYRSVIIASFDPVVIRMPFWVEYSITLTVATNPALGDLTTSTSSMDDLVSSDLSTASDAAGISGGGNTSTIQPLA